MMNPFEIMGSIGLLSIVLWVIREKLTQLSGWMTATDLIIHYWKYGYICYVPQWPWSNGKFHLTYTGDHSVNPRHLRFVKWNGREDGWEAAGFIDQNKPKIDGCNYGKSN